MMKVIDNLTVDAILAYIQHFSKKGMYLDSIPAEKSKQQEVNG